jgi:UTP--glucose-1-phosphate uridylyltransferase
MSTTFEPERKKSDLMKIRKAVLPAAGLGTRFLPATKAQPKEMLPLVDKPLIQYVVEEAVEAGIQDVILVTGRGKSAIEDHFDVSFELERFLEEKGKKAELAIVKAISDLVNVAYVRRRKRSGSGTLLRSRSRSWETSLSRCSSETTW